MLMKIQALWDMMPYELVNSYWHFSGAFSFPLQSTSSPENPEDYGSKLLKMSVIIYQVIEHCITEVLNF